MTKGVVQQCPQSLGQPIGVDQHLADGGSFIGGEGDPLGLESRSGRRRHLGHQVLEGGHHRAQVQLALLRP